jgi:hypothetical protein
MPDRPVQDFADSTGYLKLKMPQVPSGLEWIIQQIGVNVIVPTGTAAPSGICVVNVYRNNILIASTNQGRQGSCGGQPYYRITASDDLEVEWVNAGAGLQCVATISYSEHAAGTANATNTGIV